MNQLATLVSVKFLEIGKMYQYQAQRNELFTEQGQEVFLKIRDNVNALLEKSGAVRMDKAINVATGDTWLMLACVDRMVELGALREITGKNVAGQYRIFTR